MHFSLPQKDLVESKSYFKCQYIKVSVDLCYEKAWKDDYFEVKQSAHTGSNVIIIYIEMNLVRNKKICIAYVSKSADARTIFSRRRPEYTHAQSRTYPCIPGHTHAHMCTPTHKPSMSPTHPHTPRHTCTHPTNTGWSVPLTPLT